MDSEQRVDRYKRIDAYDFVIGFIALNPRFDKDIQDIRKGVDHSDLCKTILRYQDCQILKDAGIVPHPMHGDSYELSDAIGSLVGFGVLKFWSDKRYTWDFPITPIEYYLKKIKDRLTVNQASELGDISRKVK